MKNKDRVLQILYSKNGECISSSEISSELNITRSAIFKIINELKEQGHNIESIHHKGYRLLQSEDIISPAIINQNLSEYGKYKNIKYLETVDSTNTFAKKLLLEEAEEPDLVISNIQTAGRGRLGRSFFSPENRGIYASFILKPFAKIESSILITVAASVAVSKAIEKVTKLETGIKWINDIYVDQKKVCGILTEAVTNFETGIIDRIILGIGINFKASESGFPDDIAERAGALYMGNTTDDITRNQLITELILEVDKCLSNIEAPEIIEYYRQKSIVLGKQIKVLNMGEETSIKGTAVDIDKNGFLVIETETGLITLNSGEISIRF